MVTEKSALTPGLSDRPALPLMVKALSGATFDPRVRHWVFHSGLYRVNVNFDLLAEYATEDFIEAVKFPLIWYAENFEGASVEAVFGSLKYMLKAMAAERSNPVDVIDATLLINYRASLTSDREALLGSLSAFLKRWHLLGFPGVTDDAVQFIKSTRLKGFRKGVDVLTMNPLKGPLTDMERSAVQAALNDAFAVGKVLLEDYLLVWLCLLLGQRNIQFAMLKVCDIREIEKKMEPMNTFCAYHALSKKALKPDVNNSRKD